MYEGWFCFGGTEIINNSRAAGYAGTASQLVDRSVILEPGTPSEILARNLLPNPSMEYSEGSVPIRTNRVATPSFEVGSGTTEVDRNLALNPNAVPAGAAAFISNNVAVWTVTREDVGSSSNPQGITSRAKSVFNGAQTNAFILNMYNIDGRGNVGPATVLGAWFYSTAAGYQAWVGASTDTTNRVPIPAGVWTWVTGLSAANSYAGAYLQKITGNAGAADIGYITGVTSLLHRTPIATLAGGTPYPTSAAPHPDLASAWVGAANSSESVLNGVNTTTAKNGVSGYLATEWFDTGAYSIGITPSATGLVGSTALTGLVTFTAADAGKTFTAKAKVRVVVPTTTDAVYSRSFLISSNGTPTVQQGPKAPNTPGVHDLEWTFTLPADLTSGSFRFYHGGGAGESTVWLDSVVVTEGVYTGGYFDGSNQFSTRRNYMRNPRFTAGGEAWQLTTAVGEVTNGVWDVTTTGPLTSNFVTPGTSAWYAFKPGNRISASYKVQNVGTVDANLRVAIWNGSVYTYGSFTVIPPGVTEIVRVENVLVPAGSAYMQPRLHGSVPVAGMHVLVSEPIAEKAATVGPYFDGATSPKMGLLPAWEGVVDNSTSTLIDGDFTATWSGTPNNSATNLSGALPYATQGHGANLSRVIRSGHWAKQDTHSLRITPPILTGTSDTYAEMTAAVDAGQAYTVIGTIHVETPQTGVIHPRARAIYVIQGANTWLSTAAPNAAGDYEVRLDFVATATTSVTIRFYSGSDSTSSDIWWDLVFFGKKWIGSAFDGDTPGFGGYHHEWTGLPDQSTSILVRTETLPRYANYCDIRWFEDNVLCENLLTAVEGSEDNQVPNQYEASLIEDQAPWHSDSSGFVVPSPSGEFMGAYALEVKSLSDSTRQVGITEGILDGGVLGRSRRAVPTFRFRVMLTAISEEGLEYGTAWLSKALDEQSCNTHGPSCGSADLTFFSSCPPDVSEGGGWDAYEDVLNSITRMYHDVKCIEGPIVTQEFRRPERNAYGRIVEFTLAAGVPQMFGVASASGEIPQIGQAIVLDAPFNHVTHPSAEIAGASLTVATNYSTNPSVETDATGWASSQDGVNITAGMLTAGRVTGELQAVGTSSYRVVFTATGAGTNGVFYAQQEVNVSARPAGSRVSINYWAGEVLVAGTATRPDIEFVAIWRASSGGATMRTDVLGTVPVSGGSVSMKSIVPPVGATHVLVRASARVTTWNAATVLRLYVDALAVTVP